MLFLITYFSIIIIIIIIIIMSQILSITIVTHKKERHKVSSGNKSFFIISQTESRFSQVRSNINGHMKLTKRKITVLISFLQESSTGGSGFQQVRIAGNEQRTTSRPADEGMR